MARTGRDTELFVHTSITTSPTRRTGMPWHGTTRPSSSDRGANWVRIDGDAHRYGGVSRIGADTSSADTSIYGQVFMPGRGLDYNY